MSEIPSEKIIADHFQGTGGVAVLVSFKYSLFDLGSFLFRVHQAGYSLTSDSEEIVAGKLRVSAY